MKMNNFSGVGVELCRTKPTFKKHVPETHKSIFTYYILLKLILIKLKRWFIYLMVFSICFNIYTYRIICSDIIIEYASIPYQQYVEKKEMYTNLIFECMYFCRETTVKTVTNSKFFCLRRKLCKRK